MQEITCPRCGALYYPRPDIRLCPHCSSGPPTLFTKLRLQSSRIAWLFIWISLIVFSLHPPAWAWAGFTFLAALAAIAWAWSVLSQKLRRGAYEPLNLINLYPRTAPVEVNPVVPRPPPTPREWESLASLGRPREVYWPSGAKLNVIGEAALNVAFMGFLVFLARRHGWGFLRRQTFDPNELMVLIPIALWLYLLPGRIRQELAGRSLLRDGEVTIGCITTWISRDRPYQISYQFWTQSGERFEHRGILSSAYDTTGGNDRIPVFYLPQDPTKSIALCCTTSRVRMPEEKFVRDARNLLARP